MTGNGHTAIRETMHGAVRRHVAPRWFEEISHSVSALFGPALSMLRLLLTLVAVVTATLGLWRLGVDPGWTNGFFITDGLLSHWQVWIAVAAGAQTSTWALNRWVTNQNQTEMERGLQS